jgi:exonuclease VII small subunit
MSKDLTGKIPQGTDEKLDLILTTVLSMTVRFDSIDSRLHRVEEGQRTLEEGHQRLEQGQRTLEESHQRLEQGQRTLEEGQQRLEDGQRRLELGQEVLRSEVEALSRSVKHRFLILSGQVQASYNTLEKRVTVLEADSNTPNCQT